MIGNDLSILTTSYLNIEKEFCSKLNELITQFEKILLNSEIYREYLKKLKYNSKKYNPYKSIKKIIIIKRLSKDYLKKKTILKASLNYILIDEIRVLRI